LNRISAPLRLATYLAVLILGPAGAAAQKVTFIRDAEIEGTIETFSKPLFLAAGLEPSAVEIYIVNDRLLNAFVAGGQNLFLHTGLLASVEDPGQLIGVIAHETGHLAGGHLARTSEMMRDTAKRSVISALLGTAAAIGTGRSDVGIRSALQYSRTQESAADQAALRLLDATGQSAGGMLDFLEILSGQELLSLRSQDVYVRTHPLTERRMDIVREHVRRSPHTDKPPKIGFVALHGRMRAKLRAFMNPPSQTLREYAASDASIPARYARAIAHFRKPDLDRALALVDGLIAESPADPFFHELKGQILFENGRVTEALEPYQTAVGLLPGSNLLRLGLARAQLESASPEMLKPAIGNLRAALSENPDNPFMWRQLAIAYGRDGQAAMSYLALAEEALLKGKARVALYQAERAKKELATGSAAWLQAEDIARVAKAVED
jgi:predicted Zn-dependent protease